MRWKREFRAEPAEVSAAREFVAALLPEQPLRDDIITCVSELAANAVVHGGGLYFRVEVRLAPSWLRISVADEGVRAFSVPAMAARMAEDGRGLAIVRGLCRRLEVIGDARGRVVRAEFPVAEITTSSAQGAATSERSRGGSTPEQGEAAASSPEVAMDDLVGTR